MSRYVSYRDFDWLLFGFVLAICTLGVLQIHSATEHTKFAGSHIRQMYWIAAGVGGMFLMSLVNYQVLLERIHWIYIVALASLISVLLFGQKYLGARRWINLGVIVADDLEAAERRFFDVWVKSGGAAPRMTESQSRQAVAAPDVIGLFPQPGTRR